MRTIEIMLDTSMLINLEDEARAEGVSTQILIMGILNEHLNGKVSSDNSVDSRLKRMRGSLSSVKSMDMSNDYRAQQILQK